MSSPSSQPARANAPPPECRTDPERGTGELGFESSDPAEPFGGVPETNNPYAGRWYLYGVPAGQPARLVATFDSQEQLLAYVHWATLKSEGQRRGKFEQGSALASYREWQQSNRPLTTDDETLVVHNPSPNMM